MKPMTSNKAGWEGEFCDAIAAYMTDLVELGAPTKGVYVSCDGAVCAAKRRQQRLRRFKGPWAAALEAQVTGSPVAEDKWDQNALTPGSAFMARLGDVLTAAGQRLQDKKGLSVIVSTTAEPGEGEHKLLAHMRLVRPVSCTIYGLDADLILLAMLLDVDTGARVRLMREAQEFESRSAEVGGWRNLDIRALMGAIVPGGSSASRIRDFVASMSLLGNDFLPRSLTHTVRDDGIPTLVRSLEQAVWSAGLTIVDPVSGSLRRDGLLALLRTWAVHEERDLAVAAIEGIKASRRPTGIGATPEETALREWNAQPARWASVCQILAGSSLRADWRSIYAGWHPGSVDNYVSGVAWVWDYYSGRPVDQGWFFDEHLPPLWSDIVAAEPATISAPAIRYPKPLPDWLHLLAVLPADSVMRLSSTKAQTLMGSHSWYWPSSWSIFDVGRTQLWECEPVIPVILEEVLRSLDH